MAASLDVKIVLLGEGRVGKTSVLLRYVQNVFSDSQEQTLQAAFLKKVLNIQDDKIVLNIWDTAGQEKFHALSPIYYRDANAAVLVYDITDAQSFERVRHWVKELRQIVGRDIIIIIAGNKSDLERGRQVSAEEAEAYAASVGAPHFLVSAKLNKNIPQMFLHLAKELLKKRSQNATSVRRQTIRIESDAVAKPPKSGKCC